MPGCLCHRPRTAPHEEQPQAALSRHAHGSRRLKPSTACHTVPTGAAPCLSPRGWPDPSPVRRAVHSLWAETIRPCHRQPVRDRAGIRPWVFRSSRVCPAPRHACHRVRACAGVRGRKAGQRRNAGFRGGLPHGQGMTCMLLPERTGAVCPSGPGCVRAADCRLASVGVGPGHVAGQSPPRMPVCVPFRGGACRNIAGRSWCHGHGLPTPDRISAQDGSGPTSDGKVIPAGVPPPLPALAETPAVAVDEPPTVTGLAVDPCRCHPSGRLASGLAGAVLVRRV